MLYSSGVVSVLWLLFAAVLSSLCARNDADAAPSIADVSTAAAAVPPPQMQQACVESTPFSSPQSWKVPHPMSQPSPYSPS
jgi:hypothetical protein